MKARSDMCKQLIIPSLNTSAALDSWERLAANQSDNFWYFILISLLNVLPQFISLTLPDKNCMQLEAMQIWAKDPEQKK